MGDKSPKAKRKSESQKQVKTNSIHQARQQAIDVKKSDPEKNPPPGKGRKGN